jgi:hypothetical protein
MRIQEKILYRMAIIPHLAMGMLIMELLGTKVV